MMTSTIRVRVTRAFCIRGEPLAVGTIATLNGLDAHAAAGRCELVDPLDRDVIAEAVQESNRNALAAERQRSTLGRPW